MPNLLGIIAEPYWQQQWRRKRIEKLRKKIKEAKERGDNQEASYYEAELMLRLIEDHMVVH